MSWRTGQAESSALSARPVNGKAVSPGDVLKLCDEQDGLLLGYYILVEKSGNPIMVSPVGENEDGMLALCGPPQPVTMLTLIKNLTMTETRVSGDWEKA